MLRAVSSRDTRGDDGLVSEATVQTPAQGCFVRWSKTLLTIEPKRGASVAVLSARFTWHSELYPQMIPPRGTKNESASGESVSWKITGGRPISAKRPRTAPLTSAT